MVIGAASRVVDVDANRAAWALGFTLDTFAAMVEGVREDAIAAGSSGWKDVEPWPPSITVTLPPGFTRARRLASASTGRRRCSSTKQTNA